MVPPLGLQGCWCCGQLPGTGDVLLLAHRLVVPPWPPLPTPTHIRSLPGVLESVFRPPSGGPGLQLYISGYNTIFL